MSTSTAPEAPAAGRGCAVVTGASRGIGRAIAVAFAREGAQTVLAASNAANLAEGAKAVQSHLASVKAAGRADEVTAKLHEGKQEAVVGASLFRQDNASHFLVRLSPVRSSGNEHRSVPPSERAAGTSAQLPSGGTTCER